MHRRLTRSLVSMSKTTQNFTVFKPTGEIESVNLPITGGLNIHAGISKWMNDILQAINPYDPKDLTRVRNFKIVYGYQQLDDMYRDLFAHKDTPAFDAKFDQYYAAAFLSAEQQGRDLKGKEFSEAAFGGAPPTMSVHLTVALGR